MISYMSSRHLIHHYMNSRHLIHHLSSCHMIHHLSSCLLIHHLGIIVDARYCPARLSRPQVDACVLAFLRNRKHTQVESLWITRRIRRISAFPSNSERLDASVFTSTLPATKRNSRTISTRATDVIFERKHCSRRRSHTHVEITSPHKQLGNSRTITRNRWHGARIS